MTSIWWRLNGFRSACAFKQRLSRIEFCNIVCSCSEIMWIVYFDRNRCKKQFNGINCLSFDWWIKCPVHIWFNTKAKWGMAYLFVINILFPFNHFMDWICCSYKYILHSCWHVSVTWYRRLGLLWNQNVIFSLFFFYNIYDTTHKIANKKNRVVEKEMVNPPTFVPYRYLLNCGCYKNKKKTGFKVAPPVGLLWTPGNSH